MKAHSFYIEEAEKHGVEKAVILYNLRFWLEKQASMKKPFREQSKGLRTNNIST